MFTYVSCKGEAKISNSSVSQLLCQRETKLQRLPRYRHIFEVQQSNGNTWNIVRLKRKWKIQDGGRRCGNIYISDCRRDSNENMTTVILNYFPLPFILGYTVISLEPYRLPPHPKNIYGHSRQYFIAIMSTS